MKLRILNFLFWVLFFLLIVYTLFLVFFNTHGYMEFISEDGFIEYGSSLCWFFSFVCIAAYSLREGCFKLKKKNMFFLFLMFIFIVFCGEEISWGQRIFGIETPVYLSEINVQNEITLHNIGHISIFSNLFFLGNIVFFYFLNFIVSHINFIKNNIYILIPSKNSMIFFSICLIVWIVVGIRFGTLGFHPYSFYVEKYYTQMDDEIFEFLSAASFFYYSLFDVLLPNKKTMLL